MVVRCLTDNIYLPFGIRYDSLKWLNEWYTFLNIYERERKEEWIKPDTVGYIICWFDKKVLQCFYKCNDATLLVRLRIAVCMINNISPNKLSPYMKHWFMQCLWDTYRKVEIAYTLWYARNIAQLPF